MAGAFEKSPGRAPLGSSRPMFRAGSRFAITISIAESLATFAGPVGAARGGTTNGKFMRLVWPASVGAPGTVDAIPVGAPLTWGTCDGIWRPLFAAGGTNSLPTKRGLGAVARASSEFCVLASRSGVRVSMDGACAVTTGAGTGSLGVLLMGCGTNSLAATRGRGAVAGSDASCCGVLVTSSGAFT